MTKKKEDAAILKSAKLFSKTAKSAAEDAIQEVMMGDCGKQQEKLMEKVTSAILYKRMPADMILITGFRNILTADEIEKKYGKRAYDVYRRTPGHVYGMFRLEDGSFGIAGDVTGGVYPDRLYPKKDFAKLVVAVKNAGKLLAEIVAACKNGEVRSVEL